MIYIVCGGGARGKGGIGSMVHTFTMELRRARPDVRFAIVDTYGPGPFWLMPLYFGVALLRLAGCFALGRVDLVHVHMAAFGSVLRKGMIVELARLFHVPVLLHLHSGSLPGFFARRGPLGRNAIRRVIRSASEVVVLGEYWRDFVSTTFGVAARRISVLHNAAAGPTAVPLREEGGPVRLLFLGRLIPLKGLDVLLNALATDECRRRSWTLTVGGDGDMDTYRALAHGCGLDDRVRFAGWLDQKGCRLALTEAQVLVLPSMVEGLPMSVLEAMAYGLPVVATSVGAVPDAVQHGATGLMVPPGDAAALSTALVRILDDRGLRRRFGFNARARFEALFTVPAQRDRIVDIYQRNMRARSEASPFGRDAEGAER